MRGTCETTCRGCAAELLQHCSVCTWQSTAISGTIVPIKAFCRLSGVGNWLLERQETVPLERMNKTETGRIYGALARGPNSVPVSPICQTAGMLGIPGQ